MSQRYYFLSDVHLGIGKDREADRMREKRLVALLRRIEQDQDRGRYGKGEDGPDNHAAN